MATFGFTLLNQARVFYDNAENQWYNEDHSIMHPHEPEATCDPDAYVIRVYVGKGCNYRCKYCLQRDGRTSPPKKMAPEAIVQEILRVVGNAPVERIHLWGGEPLLYFDAMREYVDCFNRLKPGNSYQFTSSTNGKLLGDKRIREWVIQNLYNIQVSWDGPGQHLRGPDPLSDPEVLETIQLMRARSRNGVIFNPVMTKANPHLGRYRDALQERLGDDDFLIGPAKLLLPTDDEAAKYALDTPEELQEYSKHLQELLLNNQIPQWDFIKYNLWQTYNELGKPIEPVYCPGERKRFLIVDEAGNILTCANTSEGACGHISRIPENGERSIPPFTNLRQRRAERCESCMVYAICKGGCPKIPPRYLDSYCRGRFAELFPVYVYLLKYMTGENIKKLH